jgi:hypothetical protein
LKEAPNTAAGREDVEDCGRVIRHKLFLPT